MSRRRLLSLATLYPNAANPRFGAFVARQMEALAARGDWEVTVINPIGVPPLALGRYADLARSAVDGLEHGVTVFRSRFTLLPRLSGGFNPALIARSVLPIVQRMHREAPFDLVDAQFFYPDGPAANRIARRLGLPLSIKARGADISWWGAKEGPRRQMREAAHQADGLLAVSQALARDMVVIGMPAEKITVHYTGLDRTLFRPMDRAEARAALPFAIPDDAPLLVSVGALIPRKGQALVIDALAELPGTHLALVGQGEDRARLAAQAVNAGLADRVHFLGPVDHDRLPSLLNAADTMVLPSASEGLANAWVEALACGMPLVITDTGGAHELMRDASAGRIVARDASAIAEGVRDVLAHPLAPARVAASVADFSWQANAEALARYYDRLIARA